MKFLIDAQLPKSLPDLLNQKGFDTIHTLDLPSKNRTIDGEVARVADIEKRVVITKDSDFIQSHLIKSMPEKLVLMKVVICAIVICIR